VISVWVDVLNTADRVTLLELYARSVMLLELGRAVDWADLFGLNAQVCCAGPASARVGDTAAGTRQFKGRTELLELARRMIAGEFDLAVGVVKTPARLRHSLSDISLFADGVPGAARGYAHVTVTLVGRTGWVASGLYTDHLCRCSAGCWRFESRVLTVDGGDADGR
jgi:SnoaL-like domain